MKTLSIIAAGFALLSIVPAQAMDEFKGGAEQYIRYDILATAQVYEQDCGATFDHTGVRQVANHALSVLGGETPENVLEMGTIVKNLVELLRLTEDTQPGSQWCSSAARQINGN